MRNTFTRKEFALALACALAFAVMSESTMAANVACMQADRHVFIEVSGTRIAQ